MSDWTGGYVADIGYTHGYYAELNPYRARFALLRAGYAVPETGAACELGFGQGVSANVHAAATVTQWFGTDFNPAQAGFARHLADASGADARLYDEAFDEFCSRKDLPDFDFIGLHGIWSWISDENRQVIADFVRRKLKVGGILYISYNTQPGWAAMAPLRDLLVEHAELMGAAGAGIVSRIDGSIDFATKLLASGAQYGRANPQVGPRLEALKKQNRHYVAHEYFNRDWLPMSFSKMSTWMSDAKLSFACSAHFLEHVDGINMTAEQREVLKEVPDRMFRETVRDFMVNAQFRRDYWVKGLRPLSAVEHVETLRRQRFVLAMWKEKLTMKVTGALGEGDMNEAVYRPIISFLEDLRIHTLHDIERACEGKGLNFTSLLEAMTILVGKGAVYPVQDDKVIEAALPYTRRLNRALCERARFSDEVSVLASPVTGCGMPVPRLEQLLLLARANGLASAAEWSQYVLKVMHAQGQHVLKHGKVPETPEEELKAIMEMALEFRDHRVPVLDALQIGC